MDIPRNAVVVGSCQSGRRYERNWVESYHYPTSIYGQIQQLAWRTNSVMCERLGGELKRRPPQFGLVRVRRYLRGAAARQRLGRRGRAAIAIEKTGGPLPRFEPAQPLQ